MSEDTTLQQWVEQHKEDYAAVKERLDAVRNVTLHGPLSVAADVLERSYMFAVLSIKTERERHEDAFVGHYTGNLSRKEAALETVYGGPKSSWINRTFNNVDWETLVQAIRAHHSAGRYGQLLDVVDEQLVGVSHRKGSFMLAMAGLYEFMCVDSNVANYAGYEESDSGQSLSFNNAEDYFAACNDIQAKAALPLSSPFIVQWAIYDYERGEHARHMTYFREVLR